MPAKYMQTNVWSQSHYMLANTRIPINEKQWTKGFAQYLKSAERAIYISYLPDLIVCMSASIPLINQHKTIVQIYMLCSLMHIANGWDLNLNRFA